MSACNLLFVVIVIQLLAAVTVVGSCIVRGDTKCADGKISEYFNFIAAQTFALYAAEKGTNTPRPPSPPQGRY